MGAQPVLHPRRHLHFRAVLQHRSHRRSGEGSGDVGLHQRLCRIDHRGARAVSRRHCRQGRAPQTVDRRVRRDDDPGDHDAVVRGTRRGDQRHRHRCDCARHCRHRFGVLRGIPQRDAAVDRPVSAARQSVGTGPQPRQRRRADHPGGDAVLLRVAGERTAALEFPARPRAVRPRCVDVRAQSHRRPDHRGMAADLFTAAVSVHAGPDRHRRDRAAGGARRSCRRVANGAPAAPLPERRAVPRRAHAVQRRQGRDHDVRHDLRLRCIRLGRRRAAAWSASS